jgi:hypothetical protein
LDRCFGFPKTASKGIGGSEFSRSEPKNCDERERESKYSVPQRLIGIERG